MPRGFLFTVCCLLLLAPSAAMAHEGHGNVMHTEVIQVGPYPVTVEFNQWPIRPGMHFEVIFLPEGGIEGKLGRWKLKPAPNVFRRTIEHKLSQEPGAPDAWTLLVGGMPGNPGNWTLELSLTGPQGPGQGQMILPVADPPYFPMWLGWLVGLFPLWGLIWFVAREWRRVRRLIAQEVG